MDVLAIILACSLHPDDALVRTLVDVQSSGNIYFVGDLTTLKTNDALKSADAALQYAESLRQHGGRPAVGLLGVPLAWAGRYGRAPIELFDACTNVAIATAAFAEYRDRCSSRGSLARHRNRGPGRRRRHSLTDGAALRFCIVSRFARDLGLATAPASTLQRLIADLGAPLRGRGAEPAALSPIVGEAAPESQREASQPSRPQIFLDLAPPALTAP